MTKRFLVLATMAVFLMALSACRGPEGPQGPSGESTVVNLEGFAPGIICGNCHNPDIDTTYYVWAIKYQWAQAGHVTGGTFDDRNTAPCSGCHTSEGFVQRAKAGFPAQVPPGGWSAVTNQNRPSPVGCFACHSPHSKGDFSRRTEASVVLWSPMEGISDQTINLGKGNICLNCHQPRSTSFTPKMKSTAGASDTLKITTNRWYPHYGVQGLMFLGAGKGGGFEFPGKTYVNSPHSTQAGITQNGCPTCHMAQPVSGGNGGHTNVIGYLSGTTTVYNTNGCRQSGCHATMNVDTYVGASGTLTGGKGAHKYVHDYLDTLGTLLKAKGILSSSGLVQGNNGTSSASSSNPRTFVGPAGLLKAGALYNYFFIEHDASGGIHNPQYAIQLLNNSIEEMRKP